MKSPEIRLLHPESNQPAQLP